MIKLFISYRSTDSHKVDKIVSELSALKRYSIFNDRADIPGGSNWWARITKSILETDVFLVAVSPEAVQSSVFTQELNYALENKKTILPLMVKSAEMPPQLATRKYIDFTGSSDDGLKALRSQLTWLTSPGFARMREQLPSWLNQAKSSNEVPDEYRVLVRGRGGSGKTSIAMAIAQTLSPLPPIEWVTIPSGLMVLDGLSSVVQSFRISKYPITNAQYAGFIEAGGYSESRWWTEAGWDKKNQEKWTEPYQWTRSEFDERRHDPVVGLSWYEAKAFTLWLADETHLEFRLPTELEWERAAQSTKIYPWSGKADRWIDSSRDITIGEFQSMINPSSSQNSEDDPTVNGMGEHNSDLPLNSSSTGIHGVLDMVGNVWEWCGPYEDIANTYRIIRGGGVSHSRVAPDKRDIQIGFRCVMMEPSSSRKGA